MFRQMFSKQFLLDLKREVSEDNVFNCAAALGFYLTLSIFPAITLIMTVIPYLPIEDVDEAIMGLLGDAMPDESRDMIEEVVNDVTSERRGGLLSFSLLAALWATSTGMYAIMQQLNITYDVKEARSFLHARAIALVLSLVFGLLMLGAFMLIVLGGVLQDWVGETLDFGGVSLLLVAVFRWLVIVGALLLAFSMIYRYAPNVERKFAILTAGSVLGVVMLILASLGFAFYASNFADYSATYGSIGAVIMLMLWLYIAGLVILLGSEINVLLERYSSRGIS